MKFRLLKLKPPPSFSRLGHNNLAIYTVRKINLETKLKKK